jgi:broad specificity phosphatase PhoE
VKAIPKVTSIYTLRHGLTEYAIQKRYAGTIDVPLNETGIKDCTSIAPMLKDKRFDIVITSGLRRSIETAQLIFGQNQKYRDCSLCNERNYGLMQDLTEHKIKNVVPKVEFIKVGDDYHSLNPPKGETFEQLRGRADEFKALILREYFGKQVMVVSHGVFLQQFHGSLLGLDWEQSLANCVSYLDLSTFVFSDYALIEHNTASLRSSGKIKW